VVALGIVLVGVGMVALISSLTATLASVLLFGTLLIVGGITQLVLAFSSRGFSGIALHLILGLLSIITGVLFLRAPMMGAGALTLMVAAWLMVSGFGQAIHAAVEKFPHRGMAFFGGIVGALLGTILLASFPESSLWFLGMYLGVQFVMQGITWLSVAFVVHRRMAHLHAAT
jgi:uncharacterized membrane protein HdeD (DUF308 family)